MSFMFKPLAYDDPYAINRPMLSDDILKNITYGTTAVATKLAKVFAQKAKTKGLVVALDGYASADFSTLCSAIAQELSQMGLEVCAPSTSDVIKPTKELDEKFADCLPLNYEEDPVLLFGKIFHGSFQDFMDKEKQQALCEQAKGIGKGQVMLLCGHGSSSSCFADVVDICVYLDVTPKIAAIRAREGKLTNIGDKTPRPFKELMRRNYYVDFEIILNNRKELLNGDRLDYYICADKPDDFILMDKGTMDAIFDTLVKYPFRTKPVYLEGVWGGEFIRKARNLPEEFSNVAWIFDMIPMEVSIVVQADKKLVEFPFFTFIQSRATDIMGEKCVKAFKGYFPIRFNYDDTYHSNGNMSVQVHPERSICTEKYGEKGGQDEAYYVIATSHGAKTYVGFSEGADPDEFVKLVKQSEKDGKDVDYEKYIHHIESKSGLQVMLPGGTIHASGRGQLILELGSLTIGSYTYKMYDYNRLDADGQRRPIHSHMGEMVLHKERDAAWVKENIAIDPIPDGKGDGWEQYTLGKTDLMYYMTKHIYMDKGCKTVCSNNDQFTVLTLVDGENVKIYSKSNPDFYFEQKFLDVVVVPATIKDYVIENTGYQPCVVHKTMLKEGYEENFGAAGE